MFERAAHNKQFIHKFDSESEELLREADVKPTELKSLPVFTRDLSDLYPYPPVPVESLPVPARTRGYGRVRVNPRVRVYPQGSRRDALIYREMWE